jgi:hypothetical protein
LRDLVDLIAALEETTGCLVPQVVEPKVDDPQYLTRARERCADASWIVGEDEVAMPGLPIDNRPSFRGVFESAVIAFLVRRMFCVAHDAAA